MKKRIVITGSSRGIGLGLARYFLSQGCQVAINGSSAASTQAGLAQLAGAYHDQVIGVTADVTQRDQVEALYQQAVSAFGAVDIWINNAGITQPSGTLLETNDAVIERVLQVNLLGAINGSCVAAKNMLAQGFGAIYCMEGLGSDGRITPGMGYYGTSKTALRYFTRALANELAGSPVIVGRLSPGMVTTDLLMGDLENKPNKAELMRIFSILADKVETVAPFLGERVLRNTRNDVLIEWLTTPKILYRFLTARFIRRNPFA